MTRYIFSGATFEFFTILNLFSKTLHIIIRLLSLGISKNLKAVYGLFFFYISKYEKYQFFYFSYVLTLAEWGKNWLSCLQTYYLQSGFPDFLNLIEIYLFSYENVEELFLNFHHLYVLIPLYYLI